MKMDYFIKLTPDFGPELPDVVQGLDVTFAPPDYGWIDVTVSSGGGHFAGSLSYVYDPFENIVAFLEKVLDGHEADLGIDGEGEVYVWGVRGHERDDLVRFGIWSSDGGARTKLVPMLDIGIDRRLLVKAIYEAIWVIWEQPDHWTFIENWLLYENPGVSWEGHPPETPSWFPQMRSAKLDQLLV